MLYLCKNCGKYTTINYQDKGITDNEILVRYLEGTPTRKIATQIGKSQPTIQRIILRALKRVPNSNHITETLCDKFSGILIVDGKYVKIKGYEKKNPLIWCIDYETHDILYHSFVSGENYLAYLEMFRSLKRANYPLKHVIHDDLDCIVQAAKSVYPDCHEQLCTKHYKANIRKLLNVSEDSDDKKFFDSVILLFKSQSPKQFSIRGKYILRNYNQKAVYRSIMMDIDRRLSSLTNYLLFRSCPDTSNLIELYNSHLEARLKSLKGFSSSKYAELWLNAYVMNRRLRKFTDCGPRFKRLNGTFSLQHTLKSSAPRIYLLRNLG